MDQWIYVNTTTLRTPFSIAAVLTLSESDCLDDENVSLSSALKLFHQQ